MQACYGDIDAQKEALSKGRITQALRCQEQLKKYMEQLGETGRAEIINYKREKFAELMQSREQLEEQAYSWNADMTDCVRIEDVLERKKVMEMIQGLQNKHKQPSKDIQQETITI